MCIRDRAMVDQAYKYHGEVTLLFHNENLLLDDPHIYHTRSYRALLRQIITQMCIRDRDRSAIT